MERSEQTGLAVALIGHVVVFGLLSAQFLAHPAAMKPPETPLEVSLVEEVAPVAQAPAAAEPPAQSRAPAAGKPEDAAPAPTPAPAPPLPKAAPPKPVPLEPTPLKPERKPVPTPQPKPLPKPAAAPVPKAPVAKPRAPQPKSQSTPTPTPSAAAQPARVASKPPATPAKTPPTAATTGAKPGATKPLPTGSRLDALFKAGLSDAPSKSSAPIPPKAAVIDAKALAGIQDAIARQIQPCADRQVNPGPGANQIITVLNLRLNRDGRLATTPTVVRQSGIDSDNDRYSRRVIDLGVAALNGCAPFKLPPEYYSTPSGGWNNINYNWQLR